MSVACNPSIEAAVHGMEAHNKKKFKPTISTATSCVQCFGTEKAFCLCNSCLKVQQSTQVSTATHLRNCVMRSRASDMAYLVGMS
jgi:hypothetical protein